MAAMNAIRVPARVAEHILTSDAAAHPETDALGAALVRLLRESRVYADGSRRLADLSEDGRAVLAEYASTLADSAADEVAYGDMGALADVRAARAVLRALAPKDPVAAPTAAGTPERCDWVSPSGVRCSGSAGHYPRVPHSLNP